MSKPAVIQTHCPACEKSYSLPQTSAGHRARCAACQTVFTVEERFRFPTEDDILRWLNEAEEPDILPQPQPVTHLHDREPAVAVA
jgi:hypothetical protein